MAEPIIQMKNIEKHFGAVIALAGVSLDVVAGECHCLLGDNGAGKSTFIKTMSGVHKPTKGEIFFEGKPLVFDRPRDAISARCSFWGRTGMQAGASAAGFPPRAEKSLPPLSSHSRPRSKPGPRDRDS